MSVEQAVDDYLDAARDILGTTQPPTVPGAPTRIETLPNPDWTGNAHEAAIEATRTLQLARDRLQAAATNAAGYTQSANQIAQQAALDLDAITSEWTTTKNSIAAMPPGPTRDVALLTAAQQRIAEVVTLISATTARYNEEAANLRSEMAGLPQPDTTHAGETLPPPTPNAHPSATAPPPPPTEIPPPAMDAAATPMPGLTGALPIASPAMGAPAATAPMATAPAAAVSPLSSLGSLAPSQTNRRTAAVTPQPGGGNPLRGDFGALGKLTPDSTPGEVFAAVLAEAKARGYTLEEGLACAATMLQESSGNPRAVSSNGLWVGPFQQDTSYPGRNDPNTAIAEFFNRLDDKRASAGASSDIWKNIFWLQQRPGISTAEEAFSGGRQDYLTEIQSQLPRATQMYRDLSVVQERVRA